MNASNPLPRALLAGASLLIPGMSAHADLLTQLASFQGVAGSAEIVSFDKYSKLVFSSADTGVQFVDLANPSAPISTGPLSFLNLSTVDGLSIRSISSVAADPLGRGFGVATAIPMESGSNPGKVVFFDTTSRSILKTLDVGWHPDSIKFSSDGTKLLIANEGEPITQGANHFDRPGSLSVIDISSVAGSAQLAGLGSGQVGTFDFSAANLQSGVDLTGARVHPVNNAAGDRFKDIEPEYITQQGNRVFVTLQENNAIGEFDLASGKWTSVKGLGTITKLIDASDREVSSSVGKIEINDNIAGMPMPDALASYQVGAKTYLVTANEGDQRRPDFASGSHPVTDDSARVKDLPRASFAPAYLAHLDALYPAAIFGASTFQNDKALGRLTVSKFDHLDASGKIDDLNAFGTRSFSIWDADTGARVYDSGSAFEFTTAALFPALFNSEGVPTGGSGFDTRSDNKGAEPEGVTIGQFNGATVAFIGLERIGGVMAYNITDPTNPSFLQYINTREISPESLEFIPASDSPNGTPLLLVGYEVGNKIGVYSIDIAAVPEVGTVAPAFVGLAFGGWLLRRRTQRA